MAEKTDPNPATPLTEASGRLLGTREQAEKCPPEGHPPEVAPARFESVRAKAVTPRSAKRQEGHPFRAALTESSEPAIPASAGGGFRGYGRTLKKLPPLPETGFCRKAQILLVFPVSSSYWDREVKLGRFPQPVKVGGSNLWKAEEIHALLGSAANGELSGHKGGRR